MSTNTPNEEQTQVVFGRVVTVKHVGSRQVTQIIIEVPEEFHVPATTMLYNKDAFILPTTGEKGPKAYGPVVLGENGLPVEPEAPKAPAEPPRTPLRLNGLRIDIDPVKWLGIECTTVAFMTWLGVSSESEAIQKVRQICGVQSRRELVTNHQARAKFVQHIYDPYLRYQNRV